MNDFDPMSHVWLLEPAFAVRVTLTLLHFLWEGALLGLAALAADRVTFKRSARLRYTAFVGILSAMGAALPTTYLVVRGQERSDVRPSALAQPASTLLAANDVHLTVSQRGPASTPVVAANSAGGVSPVGSPEPALGFEPPAATTTEHRSRGLEAYASVVVAVYLLGAVVMLGRLTIALQGGRRLRVAAKPILDGPVAEMVRHQARQIGLKTAPLVAWCGRISVPVVVGIVRPMILLPGTLATGFDPSQLEAIITHELAHIRRFDPFVNLLQRLIEAVLFFHPAVWYVSRHVSAERENACDDLVVSTGLPAVHYAQALLQIAESCAAAQGIAPRSNAALAASGSGASQFKRRVLRLLAIDDGPQLRLSRGGAILLACGGIVLFMTPTLIRAVTENRDAVETKPADQEPGRDRSPILERVFAAWKARQERVNSFHFTWDTRVVVPKGFEFPDASTLAGLRTWGIEVDSDKGLEFTIPHSEWWGQGEDKFRSDIPDVVYDGANGWKQTARIRVVRNGSLHSRLETPLSKGKPSLMSIWRKVTIKEHFGPAGLAGDLLIKSRDVDLAPLRLAIRPMMQPLEKSAPYPYNTTAWLPENCRLVSDKAIVGNVHCIKLEQHLNNHLERCWIDPARDYVIVLWERKEGDAPARSVSIEYRRDSNHGWVPSRWNWEVAGTPARPTAAFEATVTSYTINAPFHDDPFALTHPPDTRIYDVTIDRPTPANRELSAAEQTQNSRKVLDDIATAWAGRQANFKSFKYAWKRESATRPPSTHTVWVDGEKFASLSIHQGPVAAAERRAGKGDRPKFAKRLSEMPIYVAHTSRAAFDGTTSTRLMTDEGSSESRAFASISSGLEENVAQFPGEIYLMDVFRPLDRQYRRFDLSKLHVAGYAKIGDVSCAVVETRVHDGRQEDYWLDPARDYLLLREHHTLNGQDWRRADISYRHDPKFGWVPAGWDDVIVGESGSLVFSATDSVTEVSLNQPIPDSEFHIEIPKGARVNHVGKKQN